MTATVTDPHLREYLQGRHRRLSAPANQIIAEAQAEAERIRRAAYREREQILATTNAEIKSKKDELTHLRRYIQQHRNVVDQIQHAEHALHTIDPATRREGQARLLLVTAEAYAYDRTDRKVTS